MILKTEKHYKKKLPKKYEWENIKYQYRKRTYYLLFGFLPIFITDICESGDYQ